ncbi:hypothetical protein Taro_030240 [Colocasia esculenta]|uniref:Transposase-associated domain-containing protein n=1 Tax=Colocasia esculenta TaxID=4460 RepID=A0A843VTJ8_COLES|nr:hypothetical protein [Colocasia esculenta]
MFSLCVCSHLAVKLLLEEATKVLQNKVQLNIKKMDWSWMDKPKHSKEYLDGVDLFIDFACGYSDPLSTIKCPCVNCACICKWDKNIVKEHLYFNGVIKDKRFWEFHGPNSSCQWPTSLDSACEDVPKDGGMRSMLQDDIYAIKNKTVIVDAVSSIDISVPSRKYDIPVYLKEWVMKDLDQKWRSWKYELRNKYFDPTLKQNKQQIPPDLRVNVEQWKIVVQTWSSNSWKRYSDINKKSKSHHKYFHCAGTKSFADINEEEVNGPFYEVLNGLMDWSEARE